MGATAIRSDAWRVIGEEIGAAAREWEHGRTQVQTAAFREILQAGFSLQDIAEALGLPMSYIRFWLTCPDQEIELATPSAATTLRWFRLVARGRREHLYTPADSAGWFGARVPELGYERPRAILRTNPGWILASMGSKWRLRIDRAGPSSGPLSRLELVPRLAYRDASPAVLALRRQRHRPH